MKTAVSLYRNHQFELNPKSASISPEAIQLVLGFGEKSLLADPDFYPALREKYPAAVIVTCSTSGEIYGESVLDNTVSVVALSFEKTRVEAVSLAVGDYLDSFSAGNTLVKKLPSEELAHILVISDGALVNGSELVRGINAWVEQKVPVTGGLAGDAARFQSTLVGLNDHAVSGNIVAIGFYGRSLEVGHGSLGGWDVFGLEREITRSVSNVLYEIDGQNALELYKKYLGDYARELPGSALLFPLSMILPGSDVPLVRTILSINNEEASMTFAGDVPKGAKVRFMKANFDRLVDAAGSAAKDSAFSGSDAAPQLALLISCVGRKLILDKRVEEEVAAVADSFHNKTLLAGFYSYGEISPFSPHARCELHNQTMTITTFSER
jgi:hypothetical protein